MRRDRQKLWVLGSNGAAETPMDGEALSLLPCNVQSKNRGSPTVISLGARSHVDSGAMFSCQLVTQKPLAKATFALFEPPGCRQRLYHATLGQSAPRGPKRRVGLSRYYKTKLPQNLRITMWVMSTPLVCDRSWYLYCRKEACQAGASWHPVCSHVTSLAADRTWPTSQCDVHHWVPNGNS